MGEEHVPLKGSNPDCTVPDDDGHSNDNQMQKIFGEHLSITKKLNLAKLKGRLIGFKKNSRGYTGMLIFAGFISLYAAVLTVQRDPVIGEQVRGLRLPMRLQNPSKKIYDTDSFWDVVTKKMIPPWFAERWEGETEGTKLSGYIAQGHNVMAGGIAIWQSRFLPLDECLGDSEFFQPSGAVNCYRKVGEDTNDLELYSSKYNVSVTIPYYRDGYTAYIPTSAPLADINRVIDIYRSANLIDGGTRQVEIRAFSFNGNLGSISSTSIAAKIDLGGHWSITYHVGAVPFALYDKGNYLQVILEVLLAFYMLFMLKGLTIATLNSSSVPRWLKCCVPHNMESKGWSMCKETFLPQAEGTAQPYLFCPWLMYSMMIASCAFWFFITQRYRQLHELIKAGEGDFRLYQNIDINDFELSASEYMHHVEPLWFLITRVDELLRSYYLMSGLTWILVVFRIYQYIEFQPKLGMLANTVRAAIVDLGHLALILIVTVLGYAVVGVFLLGLQMKGYSAYTGACLHAFQMIFGLYKIAPFQIQYGDQTVIYLYIFFFKLLVLLLLFKMLVAIIFGAYRKVMSQALKEHSVYQDIKELSFHILDWLYSFVPWIPWVSVGYMSPSLLEVFISRVANDGDGRAFSLGLTINVDGKEVPITHYAAGEDEMYDVPDAPILLKLLQAVFPEDTIQGGVPYREDHHGKFLDLTWDQGDTNPKVNDGMRKARWVITRYGKMRDDLKAQGHPMSHGEIVTVREVFRQFDDDNSGEIDIREFGFALDAMRHPRAEDTKYVQLAFSEIDTDKSGSVEFAEFCHWIADVTGFTVLDEDIANVVREEESEDDECE